MHWPGYGTMTTIPGELYISNDGPERGNSPPDEGDRACALWGTRLTPCGGEGKAEGSVRPPPLPCPSARRAVPLSPPLGVSRVPHFFERNLMPATVVESPSAVSLRDDFLLNPDVVFLNHGSFGACPKPVFAEYQRWQRELEWQPVEFIGRRLEGLMDTGPA